MKPEEIDEVMKAFGEKKDDLTETLKDITRMQNPLAGIPTFLDLRTAVPDHEKSRIERELGK